MCSSAAAGEGCYLGLLLLGGCGSWGWLRLLLVIGVCRLCHDGGLCFTGLGFRLFSSAGEVVAASAV